MILHQPTETTLALIHTLEQYAELTTEQKLSDLLHHVLRPTLYDAMLRIITLKAVPDNSSGKIDLT